MSGLLSAFVATLVTAPILGYLLVFIISKQIIKNHRRSVRLAIDVTTLLLIVSVHFLIQTIWNQSLFWVILIVLLLIAITFAILHWKVKEEINIKKVLLGFWRFSFLLFSLAYLFLVIYGLFIRIFGLIIYV